MRSAAMVLLAGAGLLLAAAAQAEEPDAARRAELGLLLTHDCGSCHGLTMKGGLGAPLLPEALAGKDLEALAQVILDGIPGTPMPPWSPLLTRDEALWMIDRLRRGGLHD
ncbi:c-type cytochrome [Azospirillum aestuarii]